MLRNYFIVGLRALAKNRTYSIINIAGLAIGMAACLMIWLFVRYETSYDRWLPGGENVYQLQSWYTEETTGKLFPLRMTSYNSEAAMRKDYPQIVDSVYAMPAGPAFLKDGQVTTTEDVLFVTGNLLDVIDLPLLRGGRNALSSAYTALLTQSEAVKRFGTDDVVGRTMTVIAKGVKTDFRIAGVLRDLPRNSHMQATMVLRIDIRTFMAKEPQFLTCWGCQSGYVYFKLRPGTDAKAMMASFPAWEKRNIADENAGEAKYNAGDDQDWKLVKIRDIHLGRAKDGAMTPGNDPTTITTFGVVAALILAMAVVNFINLATARASQRAREVALRKVLGANRRQLIVQFVGESVLVAALSMLVGMALVELLIGPFAAFLEADLQLRYFGEGGVALPIVALMLVVGVLGGLYPAFFLSRFQPASVLKANRSASETPGSGRLRSALVVAQFAVSIGLIVCTAVIYAQTVYARSADPGYRRDHILQLDGLSRYQLLTQGEMIAQRMRRLPGVVSVGRTDIGVATRNNNNTGVLVPGSPQPINIGQYRVDTPFFETMGIKLVAGRLFDDRRPMDDMTLPFPQDLAAERALVARGANAVFNEKAIAKLGFKSPADAIGKQVKASIVENELGLVPVTIIGVVQDSRFRSLRDELDPIMFQNVKASPSTMVIRYRGDSAAVHARVEAEWKRITQDVPFEAKFSDDIIQELYKPDDARTKIFAAFAGLAVIVGCLGLFGLAAFTAERRTKEIGIRKVLGARTRDIVRLLVWQFGKPVVIANLIAWPVAWWLMRDWLNGFDDRIALGPLPFVVAGGLALVIAVLTVGGHAVRIARANPIHALRYE